MTEPESQMKIGNDSEQVPGAVENSGGGKFHWVPCGEKSPGRAIYVFEIRYQIQLQQTQKFREIHLLLKHLKS